MTVIYLPIRALGDFVITASVIKDNFTEKIPVILPHYLTDIFTALNAKEYFELRDFVNYSDQPSFFELYKIKNYKDLLKLWGDIRVVNSLSNYTTKYLIDYSSKRITPFIKNIEWPQVDQNIYEGKTKLFAKHFSQKVKESGYTKSITISDNSRILIIPGSRIQTKRINDILVKKIVMTFHNKKIDVAEFSPKKFEDDLKYYSNFDQLIHLIKSYDLIISAESLPYHLANYLNKPHFVIYNNSKHFKQTFMTPFMIENDYYTNFAFGMEDAVISKLSQIFKPNIVNF